MEKDFTIEITKAQLLNQQYNSMVANNWCLVNARIYNASHTRYRKIRLVMNVDADDLYEYYYNDTLTEEENDRGYSKSEILNVAREWAWSSLDSWVESYTNVKEAYDNARKTIETYNTCGTW